MQVFEAEEVAMQLIEALRPLVPRVRARDRALADQLTRAASSVALWPRLYMPSAVFSAMLQLARRQG
jgi:hypothetical protein